MGQDERKFVGWIPSLHVRSRLLRWVTFALVYTTSVTVFVKALQISVWPPGSELTALITLGLGILIGFRNHTANERWWEARKLWGQLINDTRNLALKVRAHVLVDLAELREFYRWVAGYPHALRLHLRGITGVQAVPGFAHEPTTFPHGPGYIAGHIQHTLDRWHRAGKLSGPTTLLILDQHASAMLDVSGACERIRNTPLASSYRALLRYGILVYVLAGPWSLALEMGWWTIPILTIGFGFLLGVEITAEVIEQPFGDDGDDLPLESYCQSIEKFVWSVAEAEATTATGGQTP